MAENSTNGDRALLLPGEDCPRDTVPAVRRQGFAVTIQGGSGSPAPEVRLTPPSGTAQGPATPLVEASYSSKQRTLRLQPARANERGEGPSPPKAWTPEELAVAPTLGVTL